MEAGAPDAASLGPRTSSSTAPEEPQREGARPSEDAVLAALASRDSEAGSGSGSDSDSDDSSSKKRKKEKKEKKSKKHKKEKKSKKSSSSKKHKKEKKHKKKRKREKDSSGSSSSSDSEEDGKGPVQLSDFMKGSSRTKDDGERYSSVSGLKISGDTSDLRAQLAEQVRVVGRPQLNQFGDFKYLPHACYLMLSCFAATRISEVVWIEGPDMRRCFADQAERRERKLRKLNGGAEQDEFQHWGGDAKKKKEITDPAALALQATLRGINKQSKVGAVMDAATAKALDEKNSTYKKGWNR